MKNRPALLAIVLTIIRPSFDSFEPALLLALSFLFTRKVAGVDDPRTSLFYTSIVGTVVLSCLIPLWWKTPIPLLFVLLMTKTTLCFGH